MFSCALRSLPAILIDIGPIALPNRLPTATASISPADRDQSSSQGADATLIKIVYRYPIILYLISTKPKVLKE